MQSSKLHSGLPAREPTFLPATEILMPRFLAISTLLTLSAAALHADNWPAGADPPDKVSALRRTFP